MPALRRAGADTDASLKSLDRAAAHRDVRDGIGVDADALSTGPGRNIAELEVVAIDRDVVVLDIDGVDVARGGADVVPQAPSTLRGNHRGYRVDEAGAAIVVLGGRCRYGQCNKRDC